MSFEKSLIDVAPRQKNGLRNIQMVACLLAASVAKQLVEDVRCRVVLITAEGGDVDFCFGVDNTITVDNTLTGDQPSTAALGFRLYDKQSRKFELTGVDNFVAVRSSANCNLRIEGVGQRRNSGNIGEGP